MAEVVNKTTIKVRYFIFSLTELRISQENNKKILSLEIAIPKDRIAYENEKWLSARLYIGLPEVLALQKFAELCEEKLG